MYRSEQDVSEELESFERRENPFSLQIRGICLWRVIRSSVFSNLQALDLGGGGAPKRQEVVKAAIRSIPRILYAVMRRAKTRYGVISYPIALKISDDDGRYADFYYQSILDEIPGGVRLLHGPITRGEKRPRKGVLNLDLSLVYLLASLLAKLLPVRSADGAYFKMAGMISRNFPISDMDEASLARWFSVFWWRSYLMGLAFRMIGLKSILAINSSEYAMMNAAINSGIKAVELQHGIYTENHPDALANDAVLTFGKKALFLPDVIALYGDYWVEKLQATYAGSSVQIIAVGNNVCDSFRLVRSHLYVKDKSQLDILVTTQGLQREELIEFIKSALALIVVDVSIMLKLHPSYDLDKTVYVSALGDDGRITVVSGAESPATLDALALADLHISIGSTCHYDALSLGVPTAIMGLAGSELVVDLANNGSAIFMDSPIKMADLINHRAWIQPSERMKQYYCRSGFLDKLKGLMA